MLTENPSGWQIQAVDPRLIFAPEILVAWHMVRKWLKAGLVDYTYLLMNMHEDQAVKWKAINRNVRLKRDEALHRCKLKMDDDQPSKLTPFWCIYKLHTAFNKSIHERRQSASTCNLETIWNTHLYTIRGLPLTPPHWSIMIHSTGKTLQICSTKSTEKIKLNKPWDYTLHLKKKCCQMH